MTLTPFFSRSLWAKSASMLGLLALSQSAWALPVHIDTNGYLGNWYDPLGQRHLIGEREFTVDLAPGHHFVKVHWESGFYIEVLASGEVLIPNGLDGVAAA